MPLHHLYRSRPKMRFAQWGHDVVDFRLAREGTVHFAQWKHPYTAATPITQAEIDGLRRFIRPGDFAIDIGAHTGDTTVPMALAAGAGGCVLALEPNPHVFKVLETNALLNPDSARIDAKCFAATETDGTFTFHYGDASYCNGGFTTRRRWTPFRRQYPLTVAGRNLLHVLRTEYADWLPKLSYVKVDAEGHDRAILESILPVLQQRRPVVRTEVFRNLSGEARRRLFDLLVDNDYDLFRFEGAAEPQGAPVHRRSMTAEKHFDLLAMPRGRRTIG